MDEDQVNAANLPITALSTTSVTYTAPQVTWNQYVTRLGDVPAPENATVYVTVFNARTQSVVDQGATTIEPPNTAFLGGNANISSLVAKTNYYIELYAAPTGSIPKQVFARKCFMTGGTYTMNVNPSSQQGRTSGCFAISEFKGNMDTIQHVRNCWCGRKTVLPLFSSTQDNTNWLNTWGCR